MNDPTRPDNVSMALMHAENVVAEAREYRRQADALLERARLDIEYLLSLRARYRNDMTVEIAKFRHKWRLK